MIWTTLKGFGTFACCEEVGKADNVYEPWEEVENVAVDVAVAKY